MGKDLGAVRKEDAKVRKKSWMRRQIVREEQGLLRKMYVLLLFSFCCGRLQLTEAPQQRWPGVGRMGTRQEGKEADGEGVGA